MAQSLAEASAGSELAAYQRVMQITSGAHPWDARLRGPSRLEWLRPSLSLIGNSSLPYGRNDGAIWAGRGLTVALTGGAAFRAGPLSVSVAPLLLAATNHDFPLIATGRGGDTAYASPVAPVNIDAPQRFGPAAFAELLPGETTVRLAVGPFEAGASTAAQVWGPGVHLPLVLGTNAGGYPHAFLGTARPVSIGIGRLSGRAVWGRLTSSEWDRTAQAQRARYAPALTMTFEPAGLEGLEIGGIRFFSTYLPPGGLSWGDLLKPFESIFKKGLANDSSPVGSNPDDQVASLFARWRFPAHGFEAYVEYGRADHNWDATDFVLEPDHSAAYLLGAARVWRRPNGDLVAVRWEVANARRSQLTLDRGEPIWYRSVGTPQGHTYRGQMLGSPAVHGGAGLVLRLDRYHSRGRWSVTATREEVRQQNANYPTTGVEAERPIDALYTLGAERLWFGGRFDVTAGVTLVQELNRGFGRDAFNLNALLRLTWNLGRAPQEAMTPAATR